MNIHGLTHAELAATAAQLDTHGMADRLAVLMVTDHTAQGVLSLPILDATRAVFPSVRAASDRINGNAPGCLVGILYGLDPTAPRNLCNLWLELLGRCTDLPVHGPVTVHDGIATCSCGCSTAAVELPTALATAGA